MSLLPFLNDDKEIQDGTYIRLLPFCKKNNMSPKCQCYYDKLTEKGDGCYICPYGLSSLVYVNQGKRAIYTGLRIKGTYDKKKAKIAESNDCIYNPVIDADKCRIIAKEISEMISEKKKAEDKLEAIRELLHETRSINAQTKTAIDYIWGSTPSEEKEESIDRNTLLVALKNAHVSSYLIANRFSYFDSILNPSLSVGEPYSAVIFKKFDKFRLLFNGVQKRNVKISVNSPSQSNYRYKIYPTFETLLFILLENAIKYSPDDTKVNVQFQENNTILDVIIQSIGPYCDSNEILHLCEKGYRGENAIAATKSGQGYGLNFAKQICDFHQIGISFNSVYSHKDHGVKYGTFSVQLHFDNTINE